MLSLRYISPLGEVRFSGGGKETFMLTDVRGLALAEREYSAVSFAGYDGQETVSSRLLPRVITISGDVQSNNASAVVRNAINVLSERGVLYISDGETQRRIHCTQTIFPDAERILRGRLASFAIQLVCDEPCFEDIADTSASVYSRTKNILTPFTLPRMFGETVAGATVRVESKNSVEPIFEISFAKDIDEAATVTISNNTSGEKIELNHTPRAGEVITLDVKNRTAVSSISGNILNELTDESYLSRFKLVSGNNEIGVSAGAVTLGITVKCIYNNKYLECVVI